MRMSWHRRRWGIRLENTLKVETRVRTPLGLPRKPQVRTPDPLGAVEEVRTRPAFVPRPLRTRRDIRTRSTRSSSRSDIPNLECGTFGGKRDRPREAILGQLDRPRRIAGRRQMGQYQHSHTCSSSDLARLSRGNVKWRVLGKRSDFTEEQVRAFGKAVERFAGPAVSRVGKGVPRGTDTETVGLEAMFDRDRLDQDAGVRDLKAVPQFVCCENGLGVLETPKNRRAHRSGPTGRSEDGQRRRAASGTEGQGMDGQRKVGPVIGVKVRDPGGLDIGERTVAKKPC
jgi:hypothetical protein